MLSWVDVGKSVHGLALKTGFGVDLFVGSSVVDMYGKCTVIGDARKVFDEMPACQECGVLDWDDLRVCSVGGGGGGFEAV